MADRLDVSESPANDMVTVFLSKGKENACRLYLNGVVPSRRLLLTNVPTFLPIPAVIQQCDALLDRIRSLHIVGSSILDTYGVVLTMADIESAEGLRNELNHRPISALAKEALLVSYIHRYESDTVATPILNGTFGDNPAGSIPHAASSASSNNPDPAPAAAESASPAKTGNSPSMRDRSPILGSAAWSSNASPSPVLLEDWDSRTANCPLCLERFGGEPLLETLCGHSFHVACYANVQDETCPLCRYNPHLESTSTHCSVCNTAADLWMCLVCGVVHCGRYAASHASIHAAESKHALAVQVGGFRVWDHSRDSFVHRLVSAAEEGRVADSSGKTANGTTAWWAMGDEEEAELEQAKLESKTEYIAAFYSQLLETQLQQQHDFYEAVLADSAAKDVTLSLLRSEGRQRQTIAHRCVEAYRQLQSSFRAPLSQMIKQKERHLEKLAKELETVEAVLASAQEGKSKCEAMLASALDGEKEGKKLKPLRDRAAELEKELEALYLQFQ